MSPLASMQHNIKTALDKATDKGKLKESIEEGTTKESQDSASLRSTLATTDASSRFLARKTS